MVTIIANQLDCKYNQRQINAFYTQCKKLIEDPFEFYVFTTKEEMELLETTKKKDGYIDSINFHVPKYGLDWLEIDIMQLANDRVLFVTPNVILNNLEHLFTFKSCKKQRLDDGNLAYYIYKDKRIQKILDTWDKEEDDLLYNYDIFSEKFLIDEDNIFFLQDTTAVYPKNTDGDIVVLPQWYEDFTEDQIELMYNKATDLYPYLPENVEMEIIDNEGNQITFEDIGKTFTQDFVEKAKLKKVKIGGLTGEPTDNDDLIDIVGMFINKWYIRETLSGVDLITNGKNNTQDWWEVLGRTLGDIGSVTFNINTGNPDKIVLQNATALLNTGCRVFWSYTHTNQLDNDIKKAKKLSKEYKFTGFVYIDEVPPLRKPKKKKVKVDLPDYKLIELDTLKTRRKDDIYKERKVKFAPHVKCEGKVNNQFYLSATGNVFPCKHIALNIGTAYNSPEHKTELLYDWDKNNISNDSLENIFTNDFYKGYFNNLLKLNPQILHNEQEGKC